jgi:mRNA-degrading endonuclease RelE of RelBE toxin-antitoxin system
MTWVYELTDDAVKDLRGLPKAIQKRVARVLQQTASDPFQGDVKTLHGEEWRGIFRRRIGGYRIFFTVDQNKQKAFITRILPRSEKTYRP